MDHRLTPEEKDILIEDALKTIPLAPMPRSITVNVMARIQKDIRPKLITWDDFALSLVIALCIGALFVTAQSLPPILVVKIRVQGILLYQDILVNIRWLVPAMFFGFASLLAGLTIPTLLKMTVDRRR